jgi:hypothetical protein
MGLHESLLREAVIIFGRRCEARHTPVPAFYRRIGTVLLIFFARETVVDCDSVCLVMGPASLLLNLVGFLVFSTVALCAMYGAGGGHHQPRSWAGMARIARTRAA